MIRLISSVRVSVVVLLYSPMVVLVGCRCLMVCAVMRVLSLAMSGSVGFWVPSCLLISVSVWVISVVMSVSVRSVWITLRTSDGVE